MGRKKVDPLLKTILGYAGALGLEGDALAVKVGIPKTTLWRRLKDPDKFTRSELEHIRVRLGIPVEEMQEAVIRR